MTLTSAIVRGAYRELNLVAVNGALPTTLETEGLALLQTLASSVIGNEAGEQLQAFPLGRGNIDVPAGFPWGDGVPPGDWWVPLQARLVCNLTAPLSVDLHPMPQDGSRLAAIDVSGNFSANPLTLDGNGRMIEGVQSLTLNTDGDAREWIYRADLGEWLKVTPIALADPFPWPSEFDDMFIIMLATRIAPRFGVSISGESGAAMRRSERQFKARYKQVIEVSPDGALIPRQAWRPYRAYRPYVNGDAGVFPRWGLRFPW
jgi:hypothetical protein